MTKVLTLFFALCCTAAFAQKPVQATAGQPAASTAFSTSNTFVPGDSVLFVDYFTQEKPGNSPAKWRTSFATPIVEIAGSQWFKLLNNGEYAPKIIRTLPERYTIEFNLVADGKPNQDGYIGNLIFTFGEQAEESFTNTIEHAQILTEVFVAKDASNFFANNSMATTSSFGQNKAFANKRGQKIHVAFAVDKKRLRMWVDNEKVLDDSLLIYSKKFDTFRIGLAAWDEKDKTAKVLLSDFKYAAGPADIKKKLQKESRYQTAGISFLPGTAQLAPGAEGAVARLAAYITENGPHRFKLAAHTDAETPNAQELTKQRAELLQKLLTTQYKIEPARLETEAKGAEVPYAKGRSLEAKANNNRIEIIKL